MSRTKPNQRSLNPEGPEQALDGGFKSSTTDDDGRDLVSLGVWSTVEGFFTNLTTPIFGKSSTNSPPAAEAVTRLPRSNTVVPTQQDVQNLIYGQQSKGTTILSQQPEDRIKRHVSRESKPGSFSTISGPITTLSRPLVPPVNQANSQGAIRNPAVTDRNLSQVESVNREAQYASESTDPELSGDDQEYDLRQRPEHDPSAQKTQTPLDVIKRGKGGKVLFPRDVCGKALIKLGYPFEEVEEGVSSLTG